MAKISLGKNHVLTYSYWDTKKDKKTPTTGMGGHLKKYEKAYGKFDHRAITLFMEARGKDELDATRPAADKAAGYIPTMIKAAKALESATAKAIGKAKKNKKFPAGSLGLLQDIESSARKEAAKLTKDVPERINQTINSLKSYDSRLAATVKAYEGYRDGTLKFAVAARALGKEAEKQYKAALAADKKDDRTASVKAAIACEASRDELEETWKDSEKLTQEWRLKSGKLADFVSKDDKARKLVPISSALMDANKEIATLTKSARGWASDARDAANHAVQKASGYNV